MSRQKSGHRAPPSGTQNFFAQFSRQAQIAQNCTLFELLMSDVSPRAVLVQIEKGWIITEAIVSVDMLVRSLQEN